MCVGLRSVSAVVKMSFKVVVVVVVVVVVEVVVQIYEVTDKKNIDYPLYRSTPVTFLL